MKKMEYLVKLGALCNIWFLCQLPTLAFMCVGLASRPLNRIEYWVHSYVMMIAFVSGLAMFVYIMKYYERDSKKKPTFIYEVFVDK